MHYNLAGFIGNESSHVKTSLSLIGGRVGFEPTSCNCASRVFARSGDCGCRRNLTAFGPPRGRLFPPFPRVSPRRRPHLRDINRFPCQTLDLSLESLAVAIVITQVNQPNFPDPAQVIRPKELLHILKAEMAFEDPAFEFLRHGSGFHISFEDVCCVITFNHDVSQSMKLISYVVGVCSI